MKSFRQGVHISRRGAGVLLAMSFIGFGIIITVVTYTQQAFNFYSTIRSVVDGYRARELANAGFQASLLTLRSLPEEYLFTLGIIANPPRILLSQDCRDEGQCTQYYASYGIQPEDGKLNLNHLVRNDDDVNVSYQNIFSRLFEFLDLDVDSLGAIIDWIDENDFESTGGGEKQYYEGLSPPRKIKNAPLYSLPELATIKDFDRNIVYTARIPADFKAQQEGRASRTEEEEELIQDEDWVLANNVTAYLPRQLINNQAVSVNAARYHVLLSLSGAMTRQEVLAIFKLRGEKQGYIKEAQDLQNLPELQKQGELGGRTLAQELVVSGANSVSGFLKTKSRFYRVTGIGFVTVGTDTNEKSLALRRVWGIWDKDERQLIYYSED